MLILLTSRSVLSRSLVTNSSETPIRIFSCLYPFFVPSTTGHVAIPHHRLSPCGRPRPSLQQSLRGRPQCSARLKRSLRLALLTRRAPCLASLRRRTTRPLHLLPRVSLCELHAFARPSRALAPSLAPLPCLAPFVSLVSSFSSSTLASPRP